VGQDGTLIEVIWIGVEAEYFREGGLDNPNQLEFVQQIRANVNWAKAETSSVSATDAKIFDPSGKSPACLHRRSRRPTAWDGEDAIDVDLEDYH
jgi:hypothetical protein